MKKHLLFNASNLIMSALLLTLGITSCEKKAIDNVIASDPKEVAVAKTASKPNTYPEVSLSMTVNNAAGDKITSDVAAPYVNGTQNVKVVFDQYGNFMFSSKASNNPNVPMVRWLNYNFNEPITPNPPVTGTEIGNFISTGKTATSPAFTPLQNLAINATQCIGLSAGLVNISGSVVNFHRNLEDVSNTPTAFVYVTRINSTQWTVTPVPPLAGGCSAISNVAALRVNGTLYGDYNMPFSFTLTAL